MSSGKIAPSTAYLVNAVDCGVCPETLSFSQGLPAVCLDWSIEDSMYFREFMLEKNTLFQSGFVDRMDRSILGNKLKIQQHDLQVGFLRNQSNGVKAANECGYTVNAVTESLFEKTFYGMRYELNPQICPKNWVGTRWQNFIGESLGDFTAEQIGNTTVGQILVMRVIEAFQYAMPRTFLLGVFGSADPNTSGDDGIFAKLYYARNGQHFDTRSYAVPASGQNINAIVGGSQYNKARADFSSDDLYTLDFVAWLNSLVYSNGKFMLDVTVDLTAGLIYVVSTIAIAPIDLRIVYTDDVTQINWGCSTTPALETTWIQLDGRMQYNDVPLLFQYEAITEANFFPYFKDRLKEYKQYTTLNSRHRIADSDIKIGIDPLLLLERDGWLGNKAIECCDDNGNTPTALGLTRDRFVALDELENTGYFFISTMGNLLMFTDKNDPNAKNFRFREEFCDNVDQMVLRADFPIVGNSVWDYGHIAANILGSPLVINNDLDNRDPNEFAKLQLPCYDPNALVDCAVVAGCSISAITDIVSVYDTDNDETNITVTVTPTNIDGATYEYALNWSLSDGTSSATPVTDSSFIITLPGDETDNGLVLTVTGQVTATPTDGNICLTYISETERFGNLTPAFRCVTGTNDLLTNEIEGELILNYTIAGTSESVDFDDAGISFALPVAPAQLTDAEVEIETILPGVQATLSLDGNNLVVVLENVPSYITNLNLESVESSNNNFDIDTPCA